MKNFGTDGGKQFSYFAVRLYCEEKNNVLDMCVNALPVRHYAFICHDKDIWKDSTEGHNAGETKKAHYHIVLNMEQKTSRQGRLRQRTAASFTRARTQQIKTYS